MCTCIHMHVLAFCAVTHNTDYRSLYEQSTIHNSSVSFATLLHLYFVCGDTIDKISPRSPRHAIVNLFACASHKMYLQSDSGSSPCTPLLTTCIIACFWLSSLRRRASQLACFHWRWNKDSDMPKQAPESSAALSLYGKILRPRSWRQCRMKISHGEAFSIGWALLASHLQERVSQRPAD